MRRKLFLVLALFLFTCGTAYAASQWGTYNGRDVVRVVVNGTVVQSTVPGQIIDGSTMLPLRAVAEALGAQVEWDGKTQTAKITTPPPPAESQPSLSLAQLNEIGKSVPIIYALDENGQYVSQGSGFVYGDLIITNHHVIKNAVTLDVRFGSKVHQISAQMVFDNPDADLAAFRLSGYPSLTFATTEPKWGDKVYVLGYPDGKFTLSEGIVRNNIEYDGYYAIVSDADTEPGSSGSVMINSSGEVIGVIRGGYDTTSNALHYKHIIEELNKK